MGTEIFQRFDRHSLSSIRIGFKVFSCFLLLRFNFFSKPSVCLLKLKMTSHPHGQPSSLEPTPKLVAYNDDFEDIPLSDDIDFEVFGVVKNIIREVKRGRGQRRRFDF